MNILPTRQSHLNSFLKYGKSVLTAARNLSFALVLASCGSNNGYFPDGSTATFDLGTGTGTGFSSGNLDIPIVVITPQGQTTISVNVVDGQNHLYTGSVTLTFSSTCNLLNQIIFSSNSVVTTTGSASVTYTHIDNACTSDTITVSATDPAGNSHQALGSISINSGGGTITGAVQIGNGIGAGFVNGVLNIGTPSLSAGGSTSVIANIVDTNGALVTSSTTVTFASTCAALATATLSSNSVTTTSGTASITYTAAGCTGTDTITATTTSQGVPVSAAGAVTIAAPSAGSIQFTSNSESIIALSGTGTTTGIPENSNVVFTVLDGSGQPLSGVTINFTLSTSTGGLTLAQPSAASNASGQVTAIVQSGTVATSVRVTATVNGTALNTQSTPIVVSTGFPDQGSMSLSAVTLNPRGWDFDGTTVSITARVADRYNNRLQDGTAILFTTELGSIAGSCTTVNGACSVTWVSQNPRGTSGAGSNAGRTTILATVLGEEDFVDVDSDGTFSDGDTFTDLGEAFRDDNENGTYDSGEPFTDFNSNGIRDAGDGLYNGLNCTHSSLCSPTQAITVRQSTVLVMAEDNSRVRSSITWNRATGLPDTTYTGPSTINLPSSINTRLISALTVDIVGLVNQQILPAGTTIKFTISGTQSGNIISGGTHTVGNTSVNAFTSPSIAYYTVNLSSSSVTTDPATTNDGYLSILVDYPSGLTENYGPITITDQ